MPPIAHVDDVICPPTTGDNDVPCCLLPHVDDVLCPLTVTPMLMTHHAPLSYTDDVPNYLGI